MNAPHLIVDALCEKLNQKDVRKMLLELCQIAEMHPISKPFTVEGAEYNPGVSGFIFIEFSNICIHTFERGDLTAINVDLFSCKHFDKKKVIKYLKSKGIYQIESRRIWRNIKY